ncbi:hypothetical protein M408DRAFT_325973, partial [Serendipita vermifera MAFF 305830]
MSRLLAKPVARLSRRSLRAQSAWYNGATDRLALEIRLASQARHQATAERNEERQQREKEDPMPYVQEEDPNLLVQTPNSGALFTYKPAEDKKPSFDDRPKDSLADRPLLPRKKLRALIELYNQTPSFITPETLDSHIDREFATSPRRPQFLEAESLRREVVRQNSLPEMTTAGMTDIVGQGLLHATTERKTRAKRLAGALWGVDENGHPDLEAIEEAIEQDSGTPAMRNRRGI